MAWDPSEAEWEEVKALQVQRDAFPLPVSIGHSGVASPTSQPEAPAKAVRCCHSPRCQRHDAVRAGEGSFIS
jgi:hypothetical protein